MVNLQLILTLLLTSLLLSSDSWSADRVDPHGTISWKLYDQQTQQEKVCLSCHVQLKNKLGLASNVEKKCLSCHNRANHSGVKEHMGKSFTTKGKAMGKISCMTCHRGHRALLHHEKALYHPKSSFVKVATPHDKIPHGLVERKSHFMMLKLSCKDCHNRESLP